jgi:SAM-dependent methyltransferase
MKDLKLIVKANILRIIMVHGKHAFIMKYIPSNGKILDVGCGNNSPYITKNLRHDIFYVGLDIGLYNQHAPVNNYADKFILTTPEKFHCSIEQYSNEFDAIISSHNLEHCNDYSIVLKAMCQSLKKDGYLYLTFPCEKSVSFPSRKGTLNFYDDKTHTTVIPYQLTVDTLKQSGLDIIFARKRYKPLIPYLIGLLCEPLSWFLKKVFHRVTWALYGFETVIIGKKSKL